MILLGQVAKSLEELQRLQTEIAVFAPSVQKLSARYGYLVETRGSLTQSVHNQLNQLLEIPNGGKARDSLEETYLFSLQIWVLPRAGTISPWSSQATEILHRCDLGDIHRVERGVYWTILTTEKLTDEVLQSITVLLYDRMVETVMTHPEVGIQSHEPMESLTTVDILGQGQEILIETNRTMGLSLDKEEIDYLMAQFTRLKRNPTDVELMMFAQVNSEHCRHKVFNAQWQLGDEQKALSLFDMIRATSCLEPAKQTLILSAYRDNAAVLKGYDGTRFFPTPGTATYSYHREAVHIMVKVETHNHPTAIAPAPGAATGSGGEIRDEAATGQGGKPKAGLTGFVVSHLHVPEFGQPWEYPLNKPDNIASAWEIMTQAPLAAATYNNEFGRPVLTGFFRSYEQLTPSGQHYGYHKPIMLAGGYGTIRPQHVSKQEAKAGAKLVVLGGPAMRIGLGGGSASSKTADDTIDSELDFASVQRANAEMQRRCQEVIDRCCALGTGNPIIAIHDVGAGGLANALPELAQLSRLGAKIDLQAIPTAESGMSPLAIWCNESQERYVLSIESAEIDSFAESCRRERVPFAVVGVITKTPQLTVIANPSKTDSAPLPEGLPSALGKPAAAEVVQIPMDLLFADLPRKSIQATIPEPTDSDSTVLPDCTLAEAVKRVLQQPAVADKRFLITIGDRTVSGLVVRDQMVGPWQVPVGDCAVTASGFEGFSGEAMAIGEKAALSASNAPASGRMAVAEALTNLCAARVFSLNDICLSANWMAAAGHAREDYVLYETVEAVSTLCKTLGLVIPVGKDSLSMQTCWQTHSEEVQNIVLAPLTVVISAFARVADIRQSLTPMLVEGDTLLLLIDLGQGRQRMGGSALLQGWQQFGGAVPDIDTPELLRCFFKAVQLLNESDYTLAYHDRSDGGLFTTIAEMGFAGRCGVDIRLEDTEPLKALFNEEAGVVIQIQAKTLEIVREVLIGSGLPTDMIKIIGTTNQTQNLRIFNQAETTPIYEQSLAHLQGLWSELGYHLQRYRDEKSCAEQEYEHSLDYNTQGLVMTPTFKVEERTLLFIPRIRPKIAILREQGINGQIEMAAAFERAGFTCIDVHMQDIADNKIQLADYHGLVACGGFSYGDVLGAGRGWAYSILFNEALREQFQQFFRREDTFTLGVCNGCQMLTQLRALIPGAAHWPERFWHNQSGRFEARLAMVEVLISPSILLSGMAGSRLPIAVAHGEGRIIDDTFTPILRYICADGKIAQTYPVNPNGSKHGVTGFTSADGRATIMMPHPERVFLSRQLSYCPADWQQEYTPWMQLFINARKWLE